MKNFKIPGIKMNQRKVSGSMRGSSSDSTSSSDVDDINSSEEKKVKNEKLKKQSDHSSDSEKKKKLKFPMIKIENPIKKRDSSSPKPKESQDNKPKSNSSSTDNDSTSEGKKKKTPIQKLNELNDKIKEGITDLTKKKPGKTDEKPSQVHEQKKTSSSSDMEEQNKPQEDKKIVLPSLPTIKKDKKETSSSSDMEEHNKPQENKKKDKKIVLPSLPTIKKDKKETSSSSDSNKINNIDENKEGKKKSKLPKPLSKIAQTITSKSGILDQDEPEEEVLETDPKYDYLWKEKAAFEVENFAKNYGAKRKWVDIFWCILFWLNFIASAVIFFLAKPWDTQAYETSDGTISRDDMLIIGAICVGISFVICALTYCFILVFPRAYVKLAFVVIFILLWGSVIPLAIIVSPYYLILSGVIFVFCFYIYCRLCYYLNFSADVLKSAVTIIRHHPSTLFFNLFMFLIQSALSYMFSSGVILVYVLGKSYWLYVYIIISYFWIMQTSNYVTYTTCAGVASTWYFLNGTEYMPKVPIFWAFLHAIGPNFGACALAGLCEGISNGFRWIKKKGETLSCCSSGGCCFSCLSCCCGCFVKIVNFFVGVIDRYALIYCCMFGVPAKEGVLRWKTAKKRKIVKQVVNSCVVGTTFGFYGYSAMAIGSSIGGLLALKVFGKGTAAFTYLSGIAGTFAFNGLLLISKPVEVMSDTLFIGFSEAPLRLETGAKEIYDIFSGKTKEMLDKEINVAKGIKEPSFLDGIKEFFKRKKK